VSQPSPKTSDREAPPQRAAPVAPAPARRRTVIVSDVHLSQAQPFDETDPRWMRYRLRDYHPDDDFAGMVDHILADLDGDALELVFNGDLFDFDAPWVKNGEASMDEFSLDDAGCAEHARRILEDHPGWFDAAARVLARGHRVLFLSGNHDLELYWPGVRRVITDHLVTRAMAFSSERERAAEPDLGARVRFRTWFHVTEDRIYLEHGSQYDMLNGVPDPMLPVIADRSWIHPVCGKLAFKRTGSRMGYFNPYYEETFYMGLFGYLAHFTRDYLLSRRRHIVRTWFLGAMSTVLEIVRHRRGDAPVLSDESRELAARETGATPEQIDATYALRVPTAEHTMLPILRELWVDRFWLFVIVLLAVVAAAMVGGPLVAAATFAVLAAAFVAYELVTPKPDIRTYDSAPPEVRGLLEIHDVRAMCMGHTHRPFGRWGDDGRFWGNSGSWAPAFLDMECTQPVLPARPALMLVSEGDDLHGGLYWWKNGHLEADPEHTRQPAREEARAAE
jgi:UDP-2,3-diacylglucosamine pyrophosphatase LpxH